MSGFSKLESTLQEYCENDEFPWDQKVVDVIYVFLTEYMGLEDEDIQAELQDSREIRSHVWDLYQFGGFLKEFGWTTR